MLYYFVLGLVPLGAVVALSFVRWNGFSGGPQWAGLRNFEILWRFPQYRDALWHTIYIGGLILIASIIVGFAIALLLNTNVRGRGIYRTIWYLPTIVSFAIIAQMWNAFLDPATGVFNSILRWFGQPQINWALSTFWMVVWIVVMSTWKGVGGTMIIFLAGLQGIDPTLYEAARIDGAGRLALLRYVTLPSLRPITVFVVVTGALGAMQIFEPVYLLSKGGPFDATTVIIYRIYEDAFQNNQYGVACAMSVVFALLCMSFTVFQLRAFGSRI
jgi:ABC-type sugar transport system permease subunit